MPRTLLPLAFTAMAAATGLFGATTAAQADPPWARGGYGETRGGYGEVRGGPPAWAPAHGWRRKMERWGDDRPYRATRYREERRSYDRY
ncbi:hypothetical protein VQ03_17830 [Methylobacterium tarhaniae]|uniref:Uncharacterized protein n=1 Tax=Methylobacterium tarhaniae TaxID=1187852 RepID=A0A0J6SXU3_9HYPH|nr:hypothetical protein [Methylobacterium tarhaniae]KMO38158.1 hypothetical protein VQ03_17830 [Methylobacterium tarhaniae]